MDSSVVMIQAGKYTFAVINALVSCFDPLCLQRGFDHGPEQQGQPTADTPTG